MKGVVFIHNSSVVLLILHKASWCPLASLALTATTAWLSSVQQVLELLHQCPPSTSQFCGDEVQLGCHYLRGHVWRFIYQIHFKSLRSQTLGALIHLMDIDLNGIMTGGEMRVFSQATQTIANVQFPFGSSGKSIWLNVHIFFSGETQWCFLSLIS